MVKDIPVKIIERNGAVQQGDMTLLKEHKLAVHVNGHRKMELNCSPEKLKELVLGNLLTSGIITRADHVVGIKFSEGDHQADVIIKDNAGQRREAYSFIYSSVEWTSEDIFCLGDYLSRDTPLHRRTGGAHSCFLYRAGEIIFECEDIGRHNAIDKAIGYGLTAGVPLNTCMIYTSGRLIGEMVNKCIAAGIPVMVSKASATVEAVELAKKYGLTLIGRARRDSFTVFHDPSKQAVTF